MQLSDRQLAILITIVAVIGTFHRIETAAAWPLQNDEAVHLFRSWILWTEREYHYTPWTHGPVLYYFTAIVGPAVEWDITTLRSLLSVSWIFGLVGLWWLRDDLGQITVGVSSLVLAVHHYPTWMSTFFRNDMLLLSVLLLWLGSARRFVDTPKSVYAVAVGGIGASSIAIKENSFILAFVGITTVGVVTLLSNHHREQLISTIQRVARPAMWIPLAGLVTLIIFFSGIPPTLSGVLTAPLTALRGPLFWLEPDVIIRSRRGPWWYLGLLFRSPVLCILAAAGAIVTLRNRGLVRLYILFVGLFSFFLHSFITKQPPRFVIYMFVPMAILAGTAVDSIITKVPQTEWRTAIIFFALLIIVSAAGVPATATSTPSPNELYANWGLDRGAATALTVARVEADRTGCPVLVREGSLNHQVSNWYLRNTLGGHERMVNTTPPAVIVSGLDETRPRENMTRTEAGGWAIFTPENHCGNSHHS